MYICVECGKLIYDDDYSIWTEPHGEQLEGCPYCHGDLEEAKQCKICGEYFAEEDIWSGFCPECAKNEIDYETALKYFKANNLLRDFFFVYYWQMCRIAPDGESEEVDNILLCAFDQKALYDKETGKTTFLEQLQEYILEDIYNWTEFLEKEEETNENSKIQSR